MILVTVIDKNCVDMDRNCYIHGLIRKTLKPELIGGYTYSWTRGSDTHIENSSYKIIEMGDKKYDMDIEKENLAFKHDFCILNALENMG